MFNFEVNRAAKVSFSDRRLKQVAAAFSAVIDRTAAGKRTGKKKIRAKSRRAKSRRSKTPPFFSLAFIGETAMKRINRAYRGKNQATDVLSFVSDAAERRVGDWGEILICPAVAENQAKRFDATLDQEIARLLIHGLAHLIGYEHEDVSERTAQKMFSFEAQVREKLADSQKSVNRG